VCLMKLPTLFVFSCLALVGCSNPNSVRPDATTGALPSGTATSGVTVLPASAVRSQSSKAGFGFNGTVSGFPTGRVSLSGGGAHDLVTGFVKSGGGFSCLQDVRQGPLSVSINPNDLGACLSGQGVRWDTAKLLPSTTFKCTGAAGETLKTATTTASRVVLQADFYRAGDANDESFTAQIIVSATDIAPDFPGQNLWVQGVGCGQAIVHFSE
jgi:hypothetical protein